MMGLNNWKKYKSKKKRIRKKHGIKGILSFCNIDLDPLDSGKWIGNAKGPTKKQLLEGMKKTSMKGYFK